MVKANVDRLLDFLRKKKSASLREISRVLGIPIGDLQRSAEYLEKDKIIKIEHKFPNVVLTLLKDPGENLPANSTQDTPTSYIHEKGGPFQSSTLDGDSSDIYGNLRQKLSSSAGVSSPSIAEIKQPEKNDPLHEISKPKLQQSPLQPSLSSQAQAPVINLQPIQMSQDRPKQSAVQDTPQGEEPQNDQAQNTMQWPVQDKGDSIGKVDAPVWPEKSRYPLEGSSIQMPDDPFEKKPSFSMSPPNPEQRPKFSIPEDLTSQPEQPRDEPKDDFTSYMGDYPSREFPLPDYVETNVDKIEYLIDLAHQRITAHEYADLNVLYRKIYTMYQEANDLSPNERYLLGERLNDLFKRLKRIYLMENVV